MRFSKDFKYYKELSIIKSYQPMTIEDEMDAVEFITNKQFEMIIEPLYKWLIQLQSLGKLNFSTIISEPVGYKSPIVLIVPLSLNKTIIKVPKNIHSLWIHPLHSTMVYTIFQIQDSDSLIIDNSSYSTLLSLIEQSRIEMDTKAYKKLYKIAINRMKDFENKTKSLYYLYDTNNIPEEQLENIQAEFDNIELSGLKYALQLHRIRLNKEFNTDKIDKLTKVVAVNPHKSREKIPELFNLIQDCIKQLNNTKNIRVTPPIFSIN